MSTRFVTCAAISSQRSARWRVIEPGSRSSDTAVAIGAERLPPFVGRHPRELAEPFGLLGDRLRVQADEGFDRLLQQHRDRVMQARDHRDASPRARASAPTGSIRPRTNAHQDAAEQLILAQHLVERGALLVAQLCRARGPCSTTWRVGGNGLGLGRLQVVADVDDQRRNVIEQAVAREDFIRLDRQQVVETREPPRRQQRVLRGETLGDRLPKTRS